jgi:anti-sigma-K factor RskA
VIPADPEERDALAAEYVLGTLDARTASEVERSLATDEALRAAVAGWEARLAPLSALATPESPPPGLWDRIEAALPARPEDAAIRRPVGTAAAAARPPARLGWWRRWAIGASAVAAGLAAVLVLWPPAEEPRLMTVLLAQRDQPAWLVEAERDGAIRLAAVNPPSQSIRTGCCSSGRCRRGPRRRPRSG